MNAYSAPGTLYLCRPHCVGLSSIFFVVVVEMPSITELVFEAHQFWDSCFFFKILGSE